MAVNPDKLNQFLGKFLGDLGAAVHGASILTGEQLGLYKAVSAQGPTDSQKLAQRTGFSERYLREWLAGQAASGYIEYDAASKQYWMTPEQKFALTNEENPVYIPGAFSIVSSAYKDQKKLAEAVKNGTGFGW